MHFHPLHLPQSGFRVAGGGMWQAMTTHLDRTGVSQWLTLMYSVHQSASALILWRCVISRLSFFFLSLSGLEWTLKLQQDCAVSKGGITFPTAWISPLSPSHHYTPTGRREEAALHSRGLNVWVKS